jgi:hypothetical protein
VKRKEWKRLKAWGVNQTNAEVFYSVFQTEIIQPRLSAQESGEGGTRSGLSISRRGISYAKYGRVVKTRQNKQPFRTEDDIELRSETVRAFSGWI